MKKIFLLLGLLCIGIYFKMTDKDKNISSDTRSRFVDTQQESHSVPALLKQDDDTYVITDLNQPNLNELISHDNANNNADVKVTKITAHPQGKSLSKPHITTTPHPLQIPSSANVASNTRKKRQKKNRSDLQPSIEIRSAGFVPTGDLFKSLYGNAAGNVQIELAVKSYSHCWGVWANFDFISKDGTSLGLKKSTNAKILDFSVGFRRFWELDCFKIAVGFGANAGNIRLNNCTTCSPQCVSKWGGGFVVKSNLYYDITESLFIDLFADYTYQQIHFTTNRVNIGGFKLGAGLGINF